VCHAFGLEMFWFGSRISGMAGAETATRDLFFLGFLRFFVFFFGLGHRLRRGRAKGGGGERAAVKSSGQAALVPTMLL